MTEEVRHIHLNQRYRMVIERSAVKGIDGFKVESNGDDIVQVEQEAAVLYERAKFLTKTEGE